MSISRGLVLVLSFFGFLGDHLNAQAQATLPRVAVQYWLGGDYPNYPEPVYGNVWVDGHTEEDWEYDSEGNWVQVGDHWVDGAWEQQQIGTNILADGRFGSRWTTHLGDFPISGTASAFNNTATNRGFLANNFSSYEFVTLRARSFAPSANCSNYSAKLFRPDGTNVLGAAGAGKAFTESTYAEFSFWATTGTWRMEVSFSGATGVSPSSGTVIYQITVGPAAQTITFSPIAQHAYGDAPFAPIATSTSGLPVTFTVTSGPAQISNGILSITGFGTVYLYGSQSGGYSPPLNWASAPILFTSFSVVGYAQTISFQQIPDRMHGSGSFQLSASSSSGLPVTFSVASGPATIAGNQVTLTGSGPVTVTARQAGDSYWAAAAPISRSFMVTPDAVAPTAPTSIVAGTTTSHSIPLSWNPSTDSVGVTGYEVRRNGNSVGTATTTSFVVTGLTQSTAYQFEVRARDAAGNWSAWSDIVSATTKVATPPRLALQYWLANDYPNLVEDVFDTVWIDAHDEEDGHIEYLYEDPDHPTWITGVIWVVDGYHSVDGHYEQQYVRTDTYPNGKYGDRWSSTIGEFDIQNSASGYLVATADRGNVIAAYAPWSAIYLKVWNQVPSGNCTGFAWRLVRPTGAVLLSGTFGPDASVPISFTASEPGVYRIEIDYTGATGIAQTSGTVTYRLAVGQPQNLEFAPIPNHAGQDAPFGLTASATSGLAATFTVVSGPATISGQTLTITGYGTVIVRSSQGGGWAAGSPWAAASSIERSFTVSGLSHTISFPAIADRTYGDAALTLSPSDSANLPVTLTVQSGPALLNGTTLTLTGAGQVTVVASQSGSGSYGPAQSIVRTFTVAKKPQTIDFPSIAARNLGDPSFAPAGSASSGLPITWTVTSGPAAISASGQVSLSGLGDVFVQASQSGNANYLPAPSVTNSFVVNRLAGSYYVNVGNGTTNMFGGPPGTVVNLTAGTPPNEHGFSKWKILNGPGSLSASGSTTTNFTIGAGDATLVAEFAPTYPLAVVRGTAGISRGSSVATTSLTANANTSGGQFIGWRIVSGPGSISQAASPSATFTFGPGPSVVEAQFVAPHSVQLFLLGGFNSGGATASPTSGIRGTEMQLNVPFGVQQGYVFDGWQPNTTGMVLDKDQMNARFVIGHTDALVLGWAAPIGYREAQIHSAFSARPRSSVATDSIEPMTGRADGPTGGKVSRMTIEYSTNFGESWTTAPGGSWTGLEDYKELTVSASYTSQTTLIARVRGERPEANTTYSSLYDYTKVDFLTPGLLEVRNGVARTPSGEEGTSVNGGIAGTPITVTASTGGTNQFIRWYCVSGLGDFTNATASSTTFVMGSTGAIIQAEFAPAYSLNVKNGTPVSSGGLMGTQIQITAESRNEVFLGWSFETGLSEAGTIQNRSAAQTTFTMGNSNAVIRANYPSTDQRIVVTEGSASLAQGKPGQSTTITATSPVPGKYFLGWNYLGRRSGTILNSNQSPTTFVFGVGDTWLEADWGDGSTITVNSGRAERNGGKAGEIIGIMAQPPPAGKVFDTWVVDTSGGGTLADAGSSATSFTMGSTPATLTATYRSAPTAPVVTGTAIEGTAGLALSYQVVATNSPTGYALLNSTLPQGLTLNATTGLVSGTPTIAGVFSVTVAATNTGGTAYATFLLTIAASTIAIAPTITQHPAGIATTTGHAATFSVAATGTAPLYYQWRKDGGTINGATFATLGLSGVTTASAGSYDVIVSNTAGPVTSNPANLMVSSEAYGDLDGDGIPKAIEDLLQTNSGNSGAADLNNTVLKLKVHSP